MQGFVSKLGTVIAECLVLNRHSNWTFDKDYVVVNEPRSQVHEEQAEERDEVFNVLSLLVSVKGTALCTACFLTLTERYSTADCDRRSRCCRSTVH